MSDFDLGAYGRVINAAGRLIGETNAIYIRDVEYEIERRRAGPDVLARLIDSPKLLLEQAGEGTLFHPLTKATEEVS